MVLSQAAPAQTQQAIYGDWGLRAGPARKVALRLRLAESELTVGDSSGVHTYPVRISSPNAGTVLLVERARGTDSMTVRTRGRRTLFVDQLRGGRTVGRQIFVRLTNDELTRYELELRKAAGVSR